MNNAIEIPSRYITVKAAADYIGYHPITIYKMVKEETIPYHRLGRCIRFKKQDLDLWIKNGCPNFDVMKKRRLI